MIEAHWRYQPVWTGGTDDEMSYSLAEIFLDDEGRLENWILCEAMMPIGISIPDLLLELAHMISDAAVWKPVAFSAFKAGMVFERADG